MTNELQVFENPALGLSALWKRVERFYSVGRMYVPPSGTVIPATLYLDTVRGS